MNYQLCPAVTFCSTNGKVVFNNLDANAYLSLERAESELFHKFATHGLGADAPIFEDLRHSGLLSRTALAFSPMLPVSSILPDRSLLDGPISGVSRGNVAGAIIEQFKTAVALKVLPIRSVIYRSGRQPSRRCLIRPGDEADVLAEAARAFDLSTRLISSSEKCLRRSIALRNYLARRGVAVRLITGVKVDPFGAHAWVQYKGTVLNDYVENVLRYTPILVA